MKGKIPAATSWNFWKHWAGFINPSAPSSGSIIWKFDHTVIPGSMGEYLSGFRKVS